MSNLSQWFNTLGQAMQERRSFALADRLYTAAGWLSPSWDAPWFNRGLLAKIQHRWEESLRCNLRATEIDPTSMPAWWNLGIAATALGNWPVARRAWTSYGINIPEGDGPLQMNLGTVPIRIDPEGHAEVVWCNRIDPARAVIRSVPLPESSHAFGDLLLHDGEPRGFRLVGGQELPVFNELEILKRSPFRTILAELTVPSMEDAVDLENRRDPERLAAVEDWSSIRILCVKCSEGIPHEHDPSEGDPPEQEWRVQRRFGLAALTESVALAALEEWKSKGGGRGIAKVECVLERECEGG